MSWPVNGERPHTPWSSLLVVLLLSPLAVAQHATIACDDQARTAAAEAQQQSDEPASQREERPSDAERISRLNRSIEADHQRLLELQAEINDPEGAYHQAEEEFERLDAEVDELKKNLQELEPTGTPDEIAAAREALEERARKRKLAEQRFELEILERKTLQEQIESLEQKLAKDQAALDKLRGTSAARSDSEDKESILKLPEMTADEKAGEPEARSPGRPLPLATLSIAGSASAEIEEGEPELNDVDASVDEELSAATEQAKAKQAEALEAESEARSIAERIAILQDYIKATRMLLENARKKVDNADATVRSLDQEYRQGLLDALPAADVEALHARLLAAQQRASRMRAESREHANRLDALQTELTALQTDQIHTLQEAEARRREALAAQVRVDQLQNPLALRNVLQWLLNHAPRILTILMAMGGFVWLARVLENRLVDLMARRGSRGSVEDRENRAKTLVGVFRNAATLLIVCGGVLMIFDEVGIPVGPLMGGAAVIGLAVAFGAQSLIKDFFTGFMILLEQQFMVNDVVKIGDISGQVERITLRMTVLRDLEGRVHFIPHGQIASTTNLTHGWSRAVFDIAVSYKEDVDRVMRVLLDIGRDLRRDPEFGPLILEDPVMLGVDALAESGIVLKFYFKTRPLRQWPVKREMLRRIKNTFDELRIEIPFPHRTVFHRYEQPGVQAPHDRDWSQQHVA